VKDEIRVDEKSNILRHYCGPCSEVNVTWPFCRHRINFPSSSAICAAELLVLARRTNCMYDDSYMEVDRSFCSWAVKTSSDCIQSMMHRSIRKPYRLLCIAA